MRRILLPRGTSVYDVADACRTALATFLGLDPRDTGGLSDWFSGPYHRGVSFAGGRKGSAGPCARVPHKPISEVVSDAQSTLKSATIEASKPGAEGLIAMMPAVVDVVAVGDVFGGHGYAPLNQAHARLATRVLTLLVADYLTRPDDYLACNRHASADPSARSGRACRPPPDGGAATSSPPYTRS